MDTIRTPTLMALILIRYYCAHLLTAKLQIIPHSHGVGVSSVVGWGEHQIANYQINNVDALLLANIVNIYSIIRR